MNAACCFQLHGKGCTSAGRARGTAETDVKLLSYLYVYTCFRYFIEVWVYIHSLWREKNRNQQTWVWKTRFTQGRLHFIHGYKSVRTQTRRDSWLTASLKWPVLFHGEGDESLRGERFGHRTELTLSAEPQGPIRIHRLRGAGTNSSFKLTTHYCSLLLVPCGHLCLVFVRLNKAAQTVFHFLIELMWKKW